MVWCNGSVKALAERKQDEQAGKLKTSHQNHPSVWNNLYFTLLSRLSKYIVVCGIENYHTLYVCLSTVLNLAV